MLDENAVSDDRVETDDFDVAFDEFSVSTEVEEATDETEGDETENGNADTGNEAEQDDSTSWDSVPEALRKQFEDAQALAARLDHEAKSSNGRVSALQKKLNEYEALLQERQNTNAPESSNEESSWERYKEDFPFEAEAIEAYFNRQIGAFTGKVQGAISPLQEREQQRYIEAQQQLLSKDFPDWQQTIAAPEFAQWFQQQPAKVQELYSSTDANDYAYLLRSYDRDTADVRSAQNKVRADELAQKRQEKLKTATALPRGQATKLQGVPDDFDAAFDFYATK